MSRKQKIVVSALLALLFVAGAFYFRSSRATPIGPDPFPTPGEYGSAHIHGTMMMFVRGELIDFALPQYQLQSDLVHFEDGDGITFHKHATGITLPYFLETLNITLREGCISVEGQDYCDSGREKLRIYINDEILSPDTLLRRELKSRDKILITFGDESEVDIGLRLNAIPNIRESQ